MRTGLVGLLVAGCYSPTPPTGAPCPTGVCPRPLVCSPVTMTCEDTPGDPTVDAPADPDASTADGCYGAGMVTVCPDDPITGQDQVLINATTTLDTSTSMQCEAYHLPSGAADNSFCVVAAKTITINGRLDVRGTRPLVLLGTNAIDIDGILDVASHRTGTAGPGSNHAACVVAAATSRQGGPGGSFGTGGGDGGGSGLAGPAIAAPEAAMPSTLRGGCAGSSGAGTTGGGGGRGGGAVALISQSIQIVGTVNASGAAGSGGGLDSGGGGGGSGGMIVLDAPTVTVSGRVFANGGGAGEGGGGANPGNAGADPGSPTAPASGGGGGAGGGGDGGFGAAGTVEGEDGSSDTASGGGGGGGHGVIRVFPSQNLGGTISPAAT